ncbi:Kelch repeat-containing protein [Sphingobacterium anhuiense]|uniref:DNA-binding transcriptional activator n=1 Tax=Sphingobacterium anhuiense TaxID=493780 RepID=A0ABW5YX47_9SPHI
MKFYYIYFAIYLFLPTLSFSQGLKFNGGHHAIDKRTSYEVFGENTISFEGLFDIDFQLAIYGTNSLGNILRVQNKENNTIYNLFYDEEKDQCIFRLNEEGKSSLIIAKIDRRLLDNNSWFPVKLTFNLTQGIFKLQIKNKVFASKKIKLPNPYFPIITFGKSDYLIDVPNMGIKNLSIGNKNTKYVFPLRENEGNIVHDFEGNNYGLVSNPEWLINDSYRWQLVQTFNSSIQAGSNYNESRKEIYYFNRDSIFIHNIKTNDTRKVAFQKKCPVDLIQATNFLDVKANKLYVYELYHNYPYEGPTVASLNLDSFTWTIESYDRVQKELHHHGFFFDQQAKQYYIFGGYGNMSYSDKFYQYAVDSTKWQKLEDFTGDKLFPRYFLSAGYMENNRTAYIFGGMGNESGEHIVGRKYYYDLHKINLDTKKVTKMWDIQWKDKHVVPARGIVFLDQSHFYALCYPEHLTRSAIKLYRFSIQDGSYEILGDSVAIYSDKISTRAQLYYDHQLGRLLALVQESNDDVKSTLKIYSLNSPPISETELSNYPKKNNKIKYLIFVLFGGTVAIGAYIMLKRISNKKTGRHMILPVPAGVADSNKEHLLIKTKKLAPIGKLKPSNNEPAVWKNNLQANAIYLFGEFTVLDRNQKDISHLFSTRLKQVFCLILTHAGESGISSALLSHLVWPDKSEDKVKNSRGVTINHLRKALSELDGIELRYEKGRFKIEQHADFYCDYTRCMKLTSSINNTENRDELIHLLRRGKFLQGTNHSMFDSTKADLEKNITPLLITEIYQSMEKHAYNDSIALAEVIFLFDPLNENALFMEIKAMIALKLHQEARIRFQNFASEYRNIMGEDFPFNFEDIA